MFENKTFDSILTDMLSRVSNSFDKREGSPIYLALAPTAVELQQTYIDLDALLAETFADTASREIFNSRELLKEDFLLNLLQRQYQKQALTWMYLLDHDSV